MDVTTSALMTVLEMVHILEKLLGRSAAAPETFRVQLTRSKNRSLNSSIPYHSYRGAHLEITQSSLRMLAALVD